ncbi:MAG: (2Fe-2S)-binding protein [Candidatus Hydrogenedentota bacterium]|nr:MAG: (2Fe-2S)-binding protein [Candidatus Hydrogenedentota bacterium]
MNEEELNALMRPKKVCLCKGLTRADIEKAYDKGAKTLDAIMKETLAGTGCGTCEWEIEKILREKQQKEEQEKKGQQLELFKNGS